MHLFLKTRPFDFHLDQIFGLEEGGFMYVTVGIFFVRQISHRDKEERLAIYCSVFWKKRTQHRCNNDVLSAAQRFFKRARDFFGGTLVGNSDNIWHTRLALSVRPQLEKKINKITSSPRWQQQLWKIVHHSQKNQ